MSLVYLLELALCSTYTHYLHITPEVLIKLGGLVHSGPFHGESMLKSIFLHADIIHFLVNTTMLWYFMRALENVVGGRQATLSFIFCGMLSNLLSYAVHHEGMTVGASGAIIGTVTVCLSLSVLCEVSEFTLVPPDNNWKKLHQIRRRSVEIILLSFMPPFFGGGVDYIAHAGGILAGVIIGLFIFTQHTLRLYTLR